MTWSVTASQWWFWPFGPPGSGLGLMLTQLLFIGVVLAVIAGLLRFLFGPGGILREEGRQPPSKQQQGTEDDEPQTESKIDDELH